MKTLADDYFLLQIPNSFVTAPEIAQAFTGASQPLDDVVIKAIDVFHLGKFLWTMDDNVSWFE